MKRTLLSAALVLTISLALPVSALAEQTLWQTSWASPAIEILDNLDIELSGVSISIENNVLHITGAQGQTLQIYKITGVGVMSVRVDSEDMYVPLNLAKGCYIVKIGKLARKISIV